VKSIKLSDYNYHLPQDKIATHGIAQRDQSKLLVSKNNSISATTFSHLSEQLPSESTLFFNNTKVIQARLFLKRLTGAIIEVFLLTPADKNLSIQDTLPMITSVTFRCMIGNLKKWHSEEVLTHAIELKDNLINLQVRLINRQEKTVEFSWDSDNTSFGSIIEAIGHTPLPPYIKRKDEDEDALRYQTIYSKLPGAVAAPTAGLHFTKEVLASLVKKRIKTEDVTLHVSAGTFQPIKQELVENHPMHSEQIIVTREAIGAVLDSNYTEVVAFDNIRVMGNTGLCESLGSTGKSAFKEKSRRKG
jgi:S-adenosylmethionine:tRNA ribosyltransferase-isomerase